MRKLRTKAGVAAIAVAAAVGALAVPAITSAGALPPPATPTTLTLLSGNQTVLEPVSGPTTPVTYTIGVDSPVPTNGGIFVAATSGPDASIGYPISNAVACAPANGPGPFTCTVTPTGTPGVDNLVFFYSTNLSPAVYNSSLPHTTATLTVPGSLNELTITPAADHKAQGMWEQYTVSAIDNNGQPMNGQAFDVYATQSNGNIGLRPISETTPLGNGACPNTWVGQSGPSGLPQTRTLTVDKTNAQGTWSFCVASRIVGTVNLVVVPHGVTPPTAISATAVLTVNPGTANDVKTVSITPNNQHIFQNANVTETIQALNAQGDVVGDWNGNGPTATTTDEVPPVSVISGPNVGQTVTVNRSPVGGLVGPNTSTNPITTSATTPVGTFIATYHTLAPSTLVTTLGDDTVQAYVNQSSHAVNTEALQTGEPVATVTVHIVDKPLGINVYCLQAGNIEQRPTCNALTPTTANKTVNQVYTLDDNNTPLDFSNGVLSGIPVDLKILNTTSSVNPASAFSVSPTQATSDANGRFNVNFTDSNPVVGDSMTVRAVLDGDSTRFTDITITWGVPSDTVMIAPYVSTLKNGSTSTHTVSTVDANGNPVTNVHYTWEVLVGPISGPPTPFQTGTGTSFTYTDARKPQADHFDVIVVEAFDSSNTFLGSDTVNQYWARGGVAQQTQINVGGVSGTYTGQGVNFADPPFTPSGFTKSVIEPVTSAPTPNQGCSTPVAPNSGNCPTTVVVKLSDANNNPLFGDKVTFSSSGPGEFTDSQGNPIGTTTTALVDDNFAFGATEDGGPANQNYGYATVYVASQTAGTQTITATADGVSDTGFVHWSGQANVLAPVRIFDTRNGTGGAGGVPSQPGTPVHPNQITGFAYPSTGLPTDATAYIFNVTAIHPDHTGNLRIASFTGSLNPGNLNIPDTSLINYQVGKDTANAVIVAAGTGGLVVYSDGATVNVAVDLEGYFTAHGYQPLSFPGGASTVRAADTRTGLGVGSVGKLAAGTSKTVNLSALANSFLAAHNGHALKSVAINVTAIHPSGAGNLRIYADGQPVPTTSNINYIPGADKAAFDVVNLPADGNIRVYSDGAPVDFTVDVFGFADVTANVTALAPTFRALDTRVAPHTTITAGGQAQAIVAGVGGVPANAQAVLVSITSIHAAGSTGVGNLRVFPTGSGVPNASVVNYLSSTTDVANFAYVPVGTGGAIQLYNDSHGPINATVDVLGYIPAGS